jgi:hypothetical protein
LWGDRGICLYFDNNKGLLQATKILWSGVSFADLLLASRRQFGETSVILGRDNISSYVNGGSVYIWKTDTKWIYLYRNWSIWKNKTRRLPMMVIIDIK